jgi:hypothetical protein
LNSEQEETLLQTIKARLERNESGVVWVPDPEGRWNIVQYPTTSGLVRYFTPAYQVGIDEFGNTEK